MSTPRVRCHRPGATACCRHRAALNPAEQLYLRTSFWRATVGPGVPTGRTVHVWSIGCRLKLLGSEHLQAAAGVASASQDDRDANQHAFQMVSSTGCPQTANWSTSATLAGKPVARWMVPLLARDVPAEGPWCCPHRKPHTPSHTPVQVPVLLQLHHHPTTHDTKPTSTMPHIRIPT